MVPDGWRDLDGVTVAKRCVAFLITVLVLALLAVTALAVATTTLEGAGTFGHSLPKTHR